MKLLTLVVLGCISIFAVRNGSLDAYFQIARALAAVFLLLQLLVVLEKMFRFNEVRITPLRMRRCRPGSHAHACHRGCGTKAS